jgi:hypothetical protein
VGHGLPSAKEIYTLAWFLNSRGTSPAKLAGHIAHEYTHKFYFKDSHMKPGNNRDRSVSYAFGDLSTPAEID